MKRENMELLVVVCIALFVVVVPILTVVKMEVICGLVRGVNDVLNGLVSSIRSLLLPFWKWFWLM